MYFVQVVARVAQISNLRLTLVGRRSHKTLDGGRHVEVKRLSEFLACGRFWSEEHSHSPCLSSRQFIVLTVPWLLNGATIERTLTACVTRSTELDADSENDLLLRFRLQQVRRASNGWRELSSVYEEGGISTTFGWLLCDFNGWLKNCENLKKKIQTTVN